MSKNIRTPIRNLLLTAAVSAGLGLALPALSAPAPSSNTPSSSMSMSNANVTTDMQITQQVKSKLAAMSNLQGANIDVSTKEGKVTLTGTVTSDSQENAAKAAAQSVAGVKKVDSDLKTEKSGGGHK